MSGVFAFLTASIDSALSTYVTSVSSSLAATLAPLVVTGLSIHYTLFGLAVMRGEADASLPKLAWNLAKHSMIFSIALTAAAYQEWAVDTVNATTGLLVQAASPSGATSLAIALDQMDAQGGEYAMTVLGHGMTLMPIGGWLDLIAGIVIMVSNLALMALIGIWGILAKVALTFVLAFGPLFISLLAFPATKKFFDAWLGKVLNYLLLTVFMAAVTTFSMRIAGSFVSQMMAAGDSSNSFSDAFGFALLSITLIVVTWQMPSIASGIAGGSAVSSPTGWAAAMLAAGRRGGGGQDSSPAPAPGGGEISGQNATGNSNGGNADGPKRPVPAYRRATLDQLGRK
jgi:type IV secretion system protein VirB6